MHKSLPLVTWWISERTKRTFVYRRVQMRTCRCVKQAGWSVTVTMVTASRRNSTLMLVRSEFISCSVQNRSFVFAHVARVVACGRGLSSFFLSSDDKRQCKKKKQTKKRTGDKQRKKNAELPGREEDECVRASPWVCRLGWKINRQCDQIYQNNNNNNKELGWKLKKLIWS